MRDVPAQVRFPGRELPRRKLRLERFEKLGLRYIDFGERRQPDRGQIPIPVERWGQRLKLRHSLLVKQFVRVALLGAGELGFGERGFDFHHGAGVRFRLAGASPSNANIASTCSRYFWRVSTDFASVFK